MQLLDAGQQLAARPTPNPLLSPGWANNAPASSPPTIADPDTINAIMAELMQFLTLTGQTASKANIGQVATASMMLFGLYGIDSGGTANEYVLTPPLTLPALQDGQRVLFWTSRPNTGAPTLQLAPLAAQPIKYANGAALAVGGVISGLNELFWNAGISAFVLKPAPGAFLGVQVFAAAGSPTYTPAPNMNFVEVEVQGGGAAGGSVPATSSGVVSLGAPGTSGAYARGVFTAAQIGASLGLTVGAGGAPAAGTSGNPGGASSFGALLQCPGGVGGLTDGLVAAPYQNGNGSSTSSPSGTSLYMVRGGADAVSLATSVSQGVGAAGGRSQFGIGGGSTSSGAGASATNYGSGGGGTFGAQSTAAALGGSGGPGIIIVREYA